MLGLARPSPPVRQLADVAGESAVQRDTEMIEALEGVDVELRTSLAHAPATAVRVRFVVVGPQARNLDTSPLQALEPVPVEALALNLPLTLLDVGVMRELA